MIREHPLAERQNISGHLLRPRVCGWEGEKEGSWWGKGRYWEISPTATSFVHYLPSPVDTRSPHEQETQKDKRKVHVIDKFQAPSSSNPLPSQEKKGKPAGSWSLGLWEGRNLLPQPLPGLISVFLACFGAPEQLPRTRTEYHLSLLLVKETLQLKHF